MPELPEVETIRRQLSRQVLHKTVRDVRVSDARLLKGISPRVFTGKVKGKTIRNIFRRGKVLVLELEKDLFLIFHLRIAGWVKVSSCEEPCARVALALSSGKDIVFCDSRALGEVRLVGDWKALPLVSSMGPEPLELSPEGFASLLRGKTAKIKPLLMDQRVIAGVGNIYAQEALFCAGIHPERSAGSLRRTEADRVFRCLVKILRAAIEKKGSSISTFRQVDGVRGGFVSCFKVYGKKGERCPRCGTTLEKKTIGGRGTCFCPGCQR